MIVPTTEAQMGFGQWQAWVEGGKNKEEQLARYAKAPKHMKKRIRSHMKTVIALMESKK